MAGNPTGKYANVYTRTGGNDSVNLATETPGVDADITAFRALTDMGNAGAIGIQLEGVTYVIPVLLNA